jgi:hypothetical protein
MGIGNTIDGVWWYTNGEEEGFSVNASVMGGEMRESTGRGDYAPGNR